MWSFPISPRLLFTSSVGKTTLFQGRAEPMVITSNQLFCSSLICPLGDVPAGLCPAVDFQGVHRGAIASEDFLLLKF